MRHRRIASGIVLFGAAAAAFALAPIRPQDAPRADRAVLAAVNRGEDAIDVLVGLRDGVPSPRALALRPDPSGEPERRLLRLAAQRRLAGEFAETDLRVRRSYESFSILAGTASARGVVALANHPSVAWVTVDGDRRAQQTTPQASQLLIQSDQANALGVTGAGQAIAVLDTGVDYSVADLGGGAFPNAKVVGGMDLGDNDADPMDCEGHGTSVAAVAAGPDGVAPDATIVALKITKNTKCDTAQDSTILSAINWAVMHRDEFGIAAINLSFGGAPTDGLAHGYCDADVPQYVEAIDAANAAGMAFVASAGNDGLTNSVAAPACVSSAISVGAVYPDTHASVGWEDDSGGTLCTDAPATPDEIVCFSNSATDLSLLAPGAFWNVVTKGGETEFFHGTSAAAPAVTGAVALVRQARPDLPPSAVAGLLRGSGHPILDSRNGILTPRIDMLAAIQQSAATFASFDGTAVPIPDGSSSATARVTIAGFAGTVASVQAVVEIAHEDPRQLVVTLTGPDGTSVLLHDRSGSPEEPINAVYGRTDASAESLAAFAGRPANGDWTLTVEDQVPNVGGTIREFAVRIVPGQPRVPIPPAVASRVFPIVGHVQGTKLFLSDVRLYNPTTQDQTATLYYVPQGFDGSQAVAATLTVPAERVLALDDVIGDEFGYANSVGQLTMVLSDPSLIATSRAYTRAGNGTFGVFTPAFDSADAIGSGQTASANGLAKDIQFHTNVGFTEVAGAAASVKINIVASDGRLLASTTRDVGPNGTVLVTDIVADRGLGTTENFRVGYTVTAGSGRVIPFATLVDNVTGDGVFQAASSPAASSDDVVIAQASHATGANGDFFKSNLDVTNLGDGPVTVTVSLIPRVLTGTPASPRVYTIGAGETLEKTDLLASEFGLDDPSAAGLRIHPNGAARLLVSSRTSVEKFGGTFGFAISGVPVSEAFGFDGCNDYPICPSQAAVIQLDQTSSAQGTRANFGFAEVAGADVVVRATLRSGDGRVPVPLGGPTFSVPAGTSFQANVGQIFGGIAYPNVYLLIEVESGAGKVLAYGTSIDNTSGDAIYIPAQKASARLIPGQ